MIYLYGTGENISVVFSENTLTSQEKSEATLIVEALPEKNIPEGFYDVLFIDPTSKELKYIYKEKTLEMTKIEKLTRLVVEKKITQEEMLSLL